MTSWTISSRMAGVLQSREEALRESEERYRTILDQAADAVFMHDGTGRILDVNLEGLSES